MAGFHIHRVTLHSHIIVNGSSTLASHQVNGCAYSCIISFRTSCDIGAHGHIAVHLIGAVGLNI